MKKFSLLLLSTLMAFCLFTACGGDDEEDGNEIPEFNLSEEILGSWEVKSYEMDVDSEQPTAEKYIKSFMGRYIDPVMGSYTFESDGKIKYVNRRNTETANLDYEIQGSNITMSGFISGTYEVNAFRVYMKADTMVFSRDFRYSFNKEMFYPYGYKDFNVKLLKRADLNFYFARK